MVLIRLPLAPQERGDPRRGMTWGGRPVARNLPAYQEWLDAAAILVRSLWSEHGSGFCEGAVELDCVFVIAPPKKNRKHLYGLPVAVRPDLDRYVHAMQDAITQAGNVWEDDGRVARVSAYKRYALEDEKPCVLFAVGRLEWIKELSPAASSTSRERSVQQGGVEAVGACLTRAGGGR